MPLSPARAACTIYCAPFESTVASTATISIRNCLSLSGIGFIFNPVSGSLPRNFNFNIKEALKPSGIPSSTALFTIMSVNEAFNGCASVIVKSTAPVNLFPLSIGPAVALISTELIFKTVEAVCAIVTVSFLGVQLLKLFFSKFPSLIHF